MGTEKAAEREFLGVIGMAGKIIPDMSTHHTLDALPPPSLWVEHFAKLIPKHGRVLDLACGQGRHARLLASLGHRVEAVDCDPTAVDGLRGTGGISVSCTDLENGEWQYTGQAFDAVVVTNYLFRPLLSKIIGLVECNGLLIYETFMVGNEQFGSPRNPDFLLHENELLELVRDKMHVVAFEQGEVFEPRRAVTQRLCALGGDDPLLRHGGVVNDVRS